MSYYDHELREGEPPPLPTEPARYYPTHPLFPLAEGVRETKEIHEITFDRWNDKGCKERCPDRFPASELTSLAQVVDMFGGGTYQFIAFDSRGNFSRWTPEKEKVRIELPSKPFRQVARTEPSTQESHPLPPPPHPPPPAPAQVASPADYFSVMMQQSMAAQERADRLMAALIDRLAAPPPAPPPPPPPADPIAMLSGLATVLEKVRPAQAGDMVTQLSGLVSIVNKLKSSQSDASSPEDLTLQPFLSMVTNAMMQKPTGAQPPTTNPPAAQLPPSSPPTDLVWVFLPEHGPVLMRQEQASRLLSRPPAPALHAAPVPATPAVLHPAVAAPPGVAPVSAAEPASAPASAALSAGVPVPPAPTSATLSAVAPPAPTSPVPVSAPMFAPVPTPVPAMPVPTPAPAVDRCIVCAEPGRIEVSDPTVLICRYGHRSLLAPSRAAHAVPASAATTSAPRSLLPLDGGSITISPADLDAMLSDPEVARTLSPEIKAALEQVRTQMGQP